MLQIVDVFGKLAIISVQLTSLKCSNVAVCSLTATAILILINECHCKQREEMADLVWTCEGLDEIIVGCW